MKRFPFRASSPEPLAILPEMAGEAFGAPAACEYVPEGVVGGIAVLAISGPLEHHAHWLFTSYEEIAEQVERALCDASVSAVVLKIDSPGGLAAGMGEMHSRLRALQKSTGKQLFAFVDELACSAAYHLASACDGGIYLPRAAQVGSIGVIRCTVDETGALEKQGLKVRYLVTGRRKADLHPGAPLTDEVLDVAQAKVDYLGELFFKAVAKARGMEPEAVSALNAAVFHGKDAVRAGLADGVMGWGEFLAMLASGADRATRAISEPPKATAARTLGQTSMAKVNIEQLTEARDAARAALADAKKAFAKTPGDSSAMKRVEKALRAKIAADDAVASAGAPSAKTTTVKHIKHEEKVTEKEEDDEEEDAAEAEEEDDSTDGSTGASSTGGSSSSGSDSEEEEAEEKAISAAFASGAGLYTPARLVRLARQVVEKATGEKIQGTRAVFGALDALGQRVEKTAKLEKRLAKLEAEATSAKVDSMLSAALGEGKITKAQVPSLRAKGIADRDNLKGWLQGLPRAYRTTVGGEELIPRADADGNPLGGPTREQQAAEERLAMGKSPEEAAKLIADFRKRLSTQGAAGAPKH